MTTAQSPTGGEELMGARQEFECEGCGAKAVVSGGPDVGRFSTTLTIGCSACGQLNDAAITRFGKAVLGEGDPMPPCCRCGSDAVVAWSRGEPCPKCGEPVNATGRGAMLWD